MRALRVAARCTVLVTFTVGLGCGGPRTARPPVPASPPLRIGTSGDYAPFSIHAADGTLGGFDVEVARAYAGERGRAVVFVPFRWPDLARRLAAGDFDVVMSGVTVRPDRLVGGIMTATVARTEAVLAVAASAPWAVADVAERTIAVNRGGHLEQVARARFRHARLVAVDDNTSLPSLLASGTADAIVTDALELDAFEGRCRAAGTAGVSAPAPAIVAGAPGVDSARCFRTVAPLAHDRKAYWLPDGNAALAADLDAWLLAHERSGWLPALRARLLAAEDRPLLDPVEASVVERLGRRLALMPAVAAAKRAAGLPIEDRARETVVLHDAAARAATVGLDPQTFVALVRAEIAAAKTVQRATRADGSTPYPLDDLRRTINRLDARIAFELAALAPVDASEAAIVGTLVDDDLPGVSRALARTLARALRAVRPAPAFLSTGRAPHPGRMVSR